MESLTAALSSLMAVLLLTSLASLMFTADRANVLGALQQRGLVLAGSANPLFAETGWNIMLITFCLFAMKQNIKFHHTRYFPGIIYVLQKNKSSYMSEWGESWTPQIQVRCHPTALSGCSELHVLEGFMSTGG